MFFHKRFFISACIFISAVVLCGVAEVTLEARPFFNCINQFICIAFMVYWTNSIRKRIIEPYARRLLLASGYLLLSYFCFEIVKYRFLNVNLIWYFYYIPMTLVPLLAFFVAYEIYGKNLEKRRIIYSIFSVISIIILALILTNDFHNLAFRIGADNSYTYGPVYFAHITWSVTLLIGVLYFSIKGFYISYNKRFGLILLIPMIFEIAYTALYITGNNPEIFGIHLWSTGTVFAATCVGILEMCIQLGLIPSNSGYEGIYENLKITSGIFDKTGNCVYSSSNFNEIDLSNEDYSFKESQIRGGFVRTAVDISAVNSLNSEISAISKKLKKRNEYLISKNKTKKEKAEIEERSKIYDNIALSVMPQIEKIKALLSEDFEKNIGEIAILNAYIKRRSNMELLAMNGKIGSNELCNALLESSEYIKLSGINVVFTYSGEGEFSSQMIIETYNWFENILESCLKNLHAIAVRVKIEKDSINIRLMISAEDIELSITPSELGLDKYIEKSQITKDGNDIIISMHLKEQEVLND